MKLFLSGNFPNFVIKGKEKAFKEDLLSKGYPYHRLITFFYPSYCEVALDLIRAELPKEPIKLKRRKPREDQQAGDAVDNRQSEAIVHKNNLNLF